LEASRDFDAAERAVDPPIAGGELRPRDFSPGTWTGNIPQARIEIARHGDVAQLVIHPVVEAEVWHLVRNCLQAGLFQRESPC
jgi:hypothetical protein